MRKYERWIMYLLSGKARKYMYNLKEKTKEMASFTLGMDCEEFANLDYDDEIRYINSNKERKCDFIPNDDDRIIGRGNPFLARDEFLTIDEVNKELYGE